MEFGKTLRAAREAKGYSISQLADITHILSTVIEGLEAENFKRIAAPIYGRGFVKLCCQALDLEPQPMIDAFMAIYKGEKKPAGVVPEAPKAPVAPPPPPPPPPPPVTQPVGRKLPIGADEVPVPDPQRDLFEQPIPPSSSKPLSRFAPPKPVEEPRFSYSLPAIPWRLVGLILGAIAVIWILIAGCGALYRLMSSPKKEAPVETVKTEKPVETAKPVETTKPAETAKPVKPAETVKTTKPAAPAKAPAVKTSRKAKAVKPLYID